MCIDIAAALALVFAFTGCNINSQEMIQYIYILVLTRCF